MTDTPNTPTPQYPEPNRRQHVIEALQGTLSPESLVGSWFMKLEDGQPKWKGMVVCEAQPGAYLMEVHDPVDSTPLYQRPVALTDMLAPREEGSVEWRFYDSAEWLDRAYMAELRRIAQVKA